MCLRKYISLRGERKQYKAPPGHEPQFKTRGRHKTEHGNYKPLRDQGGDLTDPHREREKALTTQPEPKDQLPQTPD